MTFDRLSSFIRGTEREVLPVINKVGGSVDRVNAQLDKLDPATDSAVDAVEAVDEAVRTRQLRGQAAGAEADRAVARACRTAGRRSRTRRSWRDAVAEGKEAAARRERDLEDELKRARMADEITLTLPRGRSSRRVAHLVLGGLAARLDLTVESLEDLQLALDAVLDRTRRRAGRGDGRAVVRDGELETRDRAARRALLDEIERDADEGARPAPRARVDRRRRARRRRLRCG